MPYYNLFYALFPQGHRGEVWCLAISPNGDHVVSSSHDKSLRLWERTKEPIILEEEKEMVSGCTTDGDLGNLVTPLHLANNDNTLKQSTAFKWGIYSD